MKKTLKRLTTILMAAVLCFSVAVPTQAAGNRTKMMAAYRNFMEKRTSYYDQFALIYYNNDSKPDLFYSNYVDNAVYTYKKGKLVRLYSNSSTGVYSRYYPKKRVLVGAYAHMGTSTDTYYPSSGARISKSVGYGISKPIYNKITNNIYNTISKSTFNKTLKKYLRSKKQKKIKLYHSTETNRNKILK